MCCAETYIAFDSLTFFLIFVNKITEGLSTIFKYKNNCKIQTTVTNIYSFTINLHLFANIY